MILEPGCGAGQIMWACPRDMKVAKSGVKIEPVIVRIAQHLVPAHTIINGDFTRLRGYQIKSAPFVTVGYTSFLEKKHHHCLVSGD